MQWNAFIHGILSTSLAIYTTFGTCGDGKTFLNDQECRETARNSHVLLTSFTAGYLTLESFYIVTVLGIEKPIDKQSLLHHIVAASQLYLAFWQLGFPLIIGTCFLMLEISSPFVCARWLLFHHGMKGSTLETINKVCLAILFISGRCFFYTYLIIAFAVEWCTRLWFEEEDISMGYKIVVLEMVLAVFSNMILNYYWSWLIIL